MGLVLLANNETDVVRMTLFSSLDREYLITRRLIKNKTEPDTTNVIPRTLIVCRLHFNVDEINSV